jgi:hypothetical protein
MIEDIETEVVEIETENPKKKENSFAKIVQIREYLNDMYDFRYNAIDERIEFKTKSGTKWNQFLDRQRNNILIELKMIGVTRPGEDLDMLLMSDWTVEYNAPKEYFETIVPAKNGHIKLLFETLVIDTTKYQNIDKDEIYLLFEKYLISCYYCMTGKKTNDVMLMLLGGQGIFKTSWLNFLCPPFLSHMAKTGHIDLNNKEYRNNLCEKVFFNIDDQMEIIMGKEFNAMKNVISSDNETNRKAYAKFEHKRKRIVNFLGSVNNPQFLRDVQNRRYLCIPVSEIKENYKNIDINNVWSNVLAISEPYKDKYVYDKDDRALINKISENFIAPSEEQETFEAIFTVPTSQDTDNIYYMTPSELYSFMQDYTKMKLSFYKISLLTSRKKLERISKRLSRVQVPIYVYKLKCISNDPTALKYLNKYKSEGDNENTKTQPIKKLPF